MMETNQASSSPPVIRWIMAAVAIWSVILAAGVYWYVDPRVLAIPPIVAAAIVLACTLGFLAFWKIALARRTRRESRERNRGLTQDD